jgi:hypothetical protein
LKDERGKKIMPVNMMLKSLAQKIDGKKAAEVVKEDFAQFFYD